MGHDALKLSHRSWDSFPGGHIRTILGKVKDVDVALFYREPLDQDIC